MEGPEVGQHAVSSTSPAAATLSPRELRVRRALAALMVAGERMRARGDAGSGCGPGTAVELDGAGELESEDTLKVWALGSTQRPRRASRAGYDVAVAVIAVTVIAVSVIAVAHVLDHI